jgi:hypothetical protein
VFGEDADGKGLPDLFAKMLVIEVHITDLEHFGLVEGSSFAAVLVGRSSNPLCFALLHEFTITLTIKLIILLTITFLPNIHL